MPRVALLFGLLLIASLVWHPNARVYPEPDSQTEAYALYSAIYQNSKTFEPSEVLGIAAQSAELRADPNCVRSATRDDREMVDAARHIIPVVWERRFQLERAYVIVPESDKDRAIDCFHQVPEQEGSGCEQYKRLRYVRFLSVPAFNRHHTRAMVFINRMCGGLCGNGGIYVYRKTQTGWEEEKNSFARCRWIS